MSCLTNSNKYLIFDNFQFLVILFDKVTNVISHSIVQKESSEVEEVSHDNKSVSEMNKGD